MGQVLKRIREERGIEKGEKITYAGRLDPLASGLIIFLKDKERFNKEFYSAMSKEYEFDMIFGIKTDTGDVLGKVVNLNASKKSFSLSDFTIKLRKVIRTFEGKQTQTYPAYSSKTVGGIPLFEYARSSRNVVLPTREIEIYRFTMIDIFEIETTDFLKNVRESIDTVIGDFRQEEILKVWSSLAKNLPKKLISARLFLSCSSGTYVRALVEDVANEIGSFALADKIVRKSIGDFTL